MACMCGDTHCPSCGPAQGNWRCPICWAWADDGCDHLEAFCVTCGAPAVDDLERGPQTCGAHGHTVETRLKSEFEDQAQEIADNEAYDLLDNSGYSGDGDPQEDKDR